MSADDPATLDDMKRAAASAAEPDGTTESEPLASPAAQPIAEPPRVAVWAINEPADPWCPPAFKRALRDALGDETLARLLSRPLHERGEHVHAGEWHVTGALRRGRRHAHVGSFNEDALFMHASASRGVLVVADGAGSATFSRLGSAVVVEIIGSAMRDASCIDAATLHDAIERAVRALEAISAATEVPTRALRTTVLVAAWEPCAAGVRVLSTQVGDGALVIAHRDGRITRPAAGDAGDWSGEVHCFVPDAETLTFARKATVELELDDMAALLVVTDGIDDALYPFPRFAPGILGQLVHGAHVPLTGLTGQAVTSSLLSAQSPGDTLLTWLGFEKRGENDDRTLAVALHHTAPDVIAPWAPSPSA